MTMTMTMINFQRLPESMKDALRLKLTGDAFDVIDPVSFKSVTVADFRLWTWNTYKENVSGDGLLAALKALLFEPGDNPEEVPHNAYNDAVKLAEALEVHTRVRLSLKSADLVLKASVHMDDPEALLAAVGGVHALQFFAVESSERLIDTLIDFKVDEFKGRLELIVGRLVKSIDPKRMNHVLPYEVEMLVESKMNHAQGVFPRMHADLLCADLDGIIRDLVAVALEDLNG